MGSEKHLAPEENIKELVGFVQNELDISDVIPSSFKEFIASRGSTLHKISQD